MATGGGEFPIAKRSQRWHHIGNEPGSPWQRCVAAVLSDARGWLLRSASR